MIKDPQQEVFTSLLVKLKSELDCPVYDGVLPPKGTPYPFVYLGISDTFDRQLKGTVVCTVNQTIHIYTDDLSQRGLFSELCLKVKQIIRGLTRTENYGVSVMNLEQHILLDNTTSTPLLHANIQVNYHCS